MRLRFVKMQGLGNDFVVFDAVRQNVSLTTEAVRRVADRRFGVGCDQVLLVEPPPTPEVDFRYRIYNADGGEVEQCGNGARCFARFVRDEGLSDKGRIPVETAAGRIVLSIEEDGQVTVDMGSPRFAPSALPFDAEMESDRYLLVVNGHEQTLGAVSMGNPHAVLQVDDVAGAPVAELGPLIEAHPQFPNRVNVGFMEVVSRDAIRLRVYERGVGETLACGTGACAAVVVGRRWGLLDEAVTVQLPGGRLKVCWQGGGSPVWMTGPAERVFEGYIEL